MISSFSGLYADAILTPADESTLQRSFIRTPCFLILGQSVYAKAAVVNEILGFAALPVVAAEGKKCVFVPKYSVFSISTF